MEVKQTLSDILREQRLDQGFTQTSVADKIGLSQGTISNIETNPEKNLKAQKPDVVLHYLQLYKFSEGRIRQLALEFGLELPFSFMVNNQYAEASDGDKALYVGKINGGLKNALNDTESERKFVSVPSWIKDRFNLSDIFVATVTGDSMASAEVRDQLPQGTEVYFCKTLQPEARDIVAVWLQNEDVGVLKIFKPNRSYTTLESYNGSHKPITVNEDNPGVIQGVLIGYSRCSR